MKDLLILFQKITIYSLLFIFYFIILNLNLNFKYYIKNENLVGNANYYSIPIIINNMYVYLFILIM
jgi:hypothetical protein